ncbi:MAG: FimV/HubP family polar landmark protein, partial [Pseudomonadota bacterium]
VKPPPTPPAPVFQAAPTPKPEPTVSMKPVVTAEPLFDGLDMDFGTGTMALKPVPQAPVPAPVPAPSKKTDDALSASGLTFTATPLVAPKPAAPAAPAVMDSGMLEFDLGSLSLDLDGPTTESPEAEAADGPLETKFSLAEEFRALGDLDGARSLAEEVLAEAKGSLKNKAQAFLNALS